MEQSINVGESLVKLAQTSGLSGLFSSPLNLVMIAVS